MKVYLCQTLVQARASFVSKHHKVRGEISSFAINLRSHWAHANKQSRGGPYWVEGPSPPTSRDNAVLFTSSGSVGPLLTFPPLWSLLHVFLRFCSIAFSLKTCRFVQQVCSATGTCRNPGYPANCPLPYSNIHLTSGRKAAPWIPSVGGQDANIQPTRESFPVAVTKGESLLQNQTGNKLCCPLP